MYSEDEEYKKTHNKTNLVLNSILLVSLSLNCNELFALVSLAKCISFTNKNLLTQSQVMWKSMTSGNGKSYTKEILKCNRKCLSALCV